MGNIGSHVNITSERPRHQAKLERGRVSLPRFRARRRRWHFLGPPEQLGVKRIETNGSNEGVWVYNQTRSGSQSGKLGLEPAWS